MKIKLYMCSSQEKPLTENQIGLGYLKTNVTGADIEIVKHREELKDCDMIGLSTLALGLKEAVNIVRSTKIPVIVGGQGTLWNGLQDYPFKHIVIGEGERALQKIINGTEQRILREPLIENMDELNYPDVGESGPTFPLFPTRGCPFKCAFCSSQVHWKRARFNSAEYIMTYIEQIIKERPHTKGLLFADDLFIASKPRFHAFHEAWMCKGLNKRLRLAGFIRSDIFTKDMAFKMKQMGFMNVRFGAESGSNRILKLLNKQATVEDNQRAIDIAYEIGLPITAAFMYNMPTETEEERQMTNRFIRRNEGKAGDGGWYRFVAFPGTQFYNNENPLTENVNFRGDKTAQQLNGKIS